MSARCDYTEWFDGISGVDDLPGDDGFEVRCTSVADHEIVVRTDWGTETFRLCDGHAVGLLVEFPGLAILSNTPIAPAAVSAVRGE